MGKNDILIEYLKGLLINGIACHRIIKDLKSLLIEINNKSNIYQAFNCFW